LFENLVSNQFRAGSAPFGPKDFSGLHSGRRGRRASAEDLCLIAENAHQRGACL